ncbi:MAG: hypothetical protein ACI9W4_001731 [Rhodothermales bacterium]|jgi:uncharacterized protein YcbX
MSLKVESLWIYPVKACAGVRVQAAQVGARGFRGDRRWMIVDEKGGHVTQREYANMALLRPGLIQGGLRFENGPDVRPEQTAPDIPVTIWGDSVRARPAPQLVSAWLSDQIGAPVRLVHMPETSVRPVDQAYGLTADEVSFADGFPYLVTTTASLDVLNGRLDKAVPMLRFRPNVVVSGASAFEEDTWRRLGVCDAELDIVKPCARCVVIDIDPATGVSAKGVLKEAASFRRVDGKVYFGQNGIGRVLGSVWAGGNVEVLETGSSRP